MTPSPSHHDAAMGLPLVRAAAAGWTDIFHQLAKRIPFERDELYAGKTMLQWAAQGGSRAICQYLLRLGANPNQTNLASAWQRRQRPLELAFRHRDAELLRDFLAAGSKSHYGQVDVSAGYHRYREYAHPFYHAALVGDVAHLVELQEIFGEQTVWQDIAHAPYEYDNHIEYFVKGNTPLFAPLYGDHADALAWLLQQGARTDAQGLPLADVDARNAQGRTALHEAVRHGAVRCVQLLLAAGAAPNALATGHGREAGSLPLHFLPERRLHPHRFSFWSHPNWQNIQFPMFCVRAASNRSDWLDQVDAHGQTLLHRSARVGALAVCEALLHRGMQAATSDHAGRTALHEALAGHRDFRGSATPEVRLELCQLFLDQGLPLQPSPPAKDYYTLAAQVGLFPVCRLLEEHAVPAPLKDQSGSLLAAAVRFGDAPLLGELLRQGADVNALDEQSEATALHVAVQHQNLAACQLLLEAGADPNAAGEHGRSPLFSIFFRFLRHRGDFNSPHPRQTERDLLAILKLLLRYGADPRQADHDENTLFDLYHNMPDTFRQAMTQSRSAAAPVGPPTP